MKPRSAQRRRFLAILGASAFASQLPVRAAAARPKIEVWKDPECGCCGDWMEHLRKAGFDVSARDSGNIAARSRAGIAPRYGSCHTAFVDRYAIEGHVPARDILRLIKERPGAIGLAVPGMPNGSPGMEQGGRGDPYAVLLLHKDGTASVYASYPRGGGA